MTEPQVYVAVVDDEAAVCKAFDRLLRAAKFQVATFRSGELFLSSLASQVPACVVLDIHMPGLTGFDVQSRLASGSGKDVAVIVVTAHESPEVEQRVLAAGASAFLRKPVEAGALLTAIRAAIAKKAP